MQHNWFKPKFMSSLSSLHQTQHLGQPRTGKLAKRTAYGSRGARRSAMSNVAWPAFELGLAAALAEAQLMKLPTLPALEVR
jgi:hypothetical protein